MDYSCPKIFIKLLKPVFSILEKGHELNGYTDDQFIQGDTIDSYFSSGKSFIQLPRIYYLPRKICSSSLINTGVVGIYTELCHYVSLTEVKKIKIKENGWLLGENKHPTVKEVANVIGVPVSGFPAVQFGPLYYRHLQHDKSEAVEQNKGNFDKHMTQSSNALQVHKCGNKTSLTAINLSAKHNQTLQYTQSQAWLARVHLIHLQKQGGGQWLQSDRKNIKKLFCLAVFPSCFRICPCHICGG